MKIGYAFTGSFCTVSQSMEQLKLLAKEHDILPIVSEAIYSTDTRFARAETTISEIKEICGRAPITSIKAAEPLGPSNPLDVMLISPCTGNTLAKLANAITDTTVTMAAKAHLRCDRPLIIGLATNDALSRNLRNLGTLITHKSVFFIPFGQDSPKSKPHSLICDFSLTCETLEYALNGVQIQPILKRD